MLLAKYFRYKGDGCEHVVAGYTGIRFQNLFHCPVIGEPIKD